LKVINFTTRKPSSEPKCGYVWPEDAGVVDVEAVEGAEDTEDAEAAEGVEDTEDTEDAEVVEGVEDTDTEDTEGAEGTERTKGAVPVKIIHVWHDLAWTTAKITARNKQGDAYVYTTTPVDLKQ
jgi:hypothetical protein